MHGRKQNSLIPSDSERTAVAPSKVQGQFPAFISAQPDGVLLAIKLQPRASKNEIGEPLGVELRVKVTAPPVDAAANEALIRLLAEALNCPRSKVELIRGHTSRHKLLKIHGLSAQEVLRCLP